MLRQIDNIADNQTAIAEVAGSKIDVFAEPITPITDCGEVTAHIIPNDDAMVNLLFLQ